MAGQHATLITEVPARRGQIITWSGTPRVRYQPIFTAERDMVLDHARVRYRVAEGGALTLVIGRAASGTGPSSATAVTGTADINTTVNTNYGMDLVTSKGVPSENIIPAGSTVYAVYSGVPATADDLVITLRVSDRLN